MAPTIMTGEGVAARLEERGEVIPFKNDVTNDGSDVKVWMTNETSSEVTETPRATGSSNQLTVTSDLQPSYGSHVDTVARSAFMTTSAPISTGVTPTERTVTHEVVGGGMEAVSGLSSTDQRSGDAICTPVSDGAPGPDIVGADVAETQFSGCRLDKEGQPSADDTLFSPELIGPPPADIVDPDSKTVVSNGSPRHDTVDTTGVTWTFDEKSTDSDVLEVSVEKRALRPRRAVSYKEPEALQEPFDSENEDDDQEEEEKERLLIEEEGATSDEYDTDDEERQSEADRSEEKDRTYALPGEEDTDYSTDTEDDMAEYVDEMEEEMSIDEEEDHSDDCMCVEDGDEESYDCEAECDVSSRPMWVAPVEERETSTNTSAVDVSTLPGNTIL